MHEHNIFTLLKEFSLEELNKLENFINSPYHNKSKKIVKLFKEIKIYYPEFSDKKLTKEFISKRINPELKYNDSTIRDLMSILLACTEEFLCLEEINKNQLEKDIFLLRSFVEKRQSSLLNRQVTKLENKLDNEGVDSSYYYNKSIIEMNKFNFNISNYQQKSSLIIENNNDILVTYIICIVNHFVTELVNSYIKTIIIGTKFKSDHKSNIPLKLIESINLNEILKTIKRVDKKYFIFEIYLNLFYAFQNNSSSGFYSKYKSLFLKHSKSLSEDEISFHFSMLISWCMINKSSVESNISYDIELFRIYEIFLKNKFFIDKKSKYIDEDLYRNILNSALRLNKYNWVLNFITIYSKYLHPDKKVNLVRLSYAEYYYHSGSNKKSAKDLNKAFNFLKDIQEESFIIKYDIKSLYLMIFYDLKYEDHSITQINNYRKFLKRNTLVTDIRKKKIYAFLNIFEKLVYLREGEKKISISDLNFDLTKNKDIDHRDWILKKIEELNLVS